MKDANGTPSCWVLEAIPAGTDPASGASIVQLTSESVTSHNIYCEQRYACADGTRIAIARLPFSRAQETWVCDLTGKTRLIRGAEGMPVAANSCRDAVYYFQTDNGQNVLMRLDLKTLANKELCRFPENAQVVAFCRFAPKTAVSPDERWLVSGPFHVKDNIYSLRIVELARGDECALCEVEDMFNPHLQFDPAGSGRLLVQVNRGGSAPWKHDGRPLAGPDGSTLIVVDVPSGMVTPLPVGAPDTARISGHLCWIDQTGRILFTAAPGKSETGIYELTPGDAKARHIVSGEPFNHIAASDDGQFFIVDNHKTQRIFVGSIKTGRFLPLCDSHTRQRSPQYTHAHPYMTPDNQYVIFNCSVEEGVSQVYAARIPEGFLEKLLATEAEGPP